MFEGKSFHIHAPVTGKARRPTVESLTPGQLTKRNMTNTDFDTSLDKFAATYVSLRTLSICRTQRVWWMVHGVTRDSLAPDGRMTYARLLAEQRAWRTTEVPSSQFGLLAGDNDRRNEASVCVMKRQRAYSKASEITPFLFRSPVHLQRWSPSCFSCRGRVSHWLGMPSFKRLKVKRLDLKVRINVNQLERSLNGDHSTTVVKQLFFIQTLNSLF